MVGRRLGVIVAMETTALGIRSGTRGVTSLARISLAARPVSQTFASVALASVGLASAGRERR